jgi:hypothetical protein
MENRGEFINIFSSENSENEIKQKFLEFQSEYPQAYYLIPPLIKSLMAFENASRAAKFLANQIQNRKVKVGIGSLYPAI